MKTRVALATLAAFVGVVLFGVTGASARSTPTTSPITQAVTGTAATGQTFAGTFQLLRLEKNPVINPVAPSLVANGSLVGTLAGKTVPKRAVSIPVSLAPSAAGARTAAAAAPIGCPVLNLVLGPLNLNLLGLVVTLNQVILNITAVPGAGALLGNLLCAVVNLLNGPPLAGLAPLLAVINTVLSNLGKV